MMINVVFSYRYALIEILFLEGNVNTYILYTYKSSDNYSSVEIGHPVKNITIIGFRLYLLCDFFLSIEQPFHKMSTYVLSDRNLHTLYRTFLLLLISTLYQTERNFTFCEIF